MFYFRKEGVEQGFQRLLKIDDVGNKALDEFRECLDCWSIQPKNKRKKNKEKQKPKEADAEEVFTADIEELGNCIDKAFM